MDPVTILRQAAGDEPIWRQLPDSTWRIVGSDAELADCRIGDLRIGTSAKIWFVGSPFVGAGGFGWQLPVGSPPKFYRLATQIKSDGTQDLPVAELQRRYSHLGRNGRLDPRTIKKALALIPKS